MCRLFEQLNGAPPPPPRAGPVFKGSKGLALCEYSLPERLQGKVVAIFRTVCTAPKVANPAQLVPQRRFTDQELRVSYNFHDSECLYNFRPRARETVFNGPYRDINQNWRVALRLSETWHAPSLYFILFLAF